MENNLIPAKCADLQTPGSGSVVMSTDGSTTSAKYTCDIGSTLVGESTPTCNSDGTWTSTSPTCGIQIDLKTYLAYAFKIRKTYTYFYALLTLNIQQAFYF